VDVHADTAGRSQPEVSSTAASTIAAARGPVTR
jgi:hypothetical protein